MKDKILSIQSKLVYGYVGSNIAELAIQLHGLDVIAFPTVYLSAHTGHQPVYGTMIESKLFDQLAEGIAHLGVIESTAHLISGYIGSADMLDSVSEFIKKIKTQYPDKLYICDPVMGDVDGLYIDQSLAKALIDKLLPICDIMTPNHYEFEHIAGTKARNKEDILEAVNAHPILKEKIVIITSCFLQDTPSDEIETLIVKGKNCKRITAKKIDIQTTGTGDLFTAVTASQLALGKDVISAVTEAIQTVKRALDMTLELGNEEMNAACLLHSIIGGRR